MRMPVMVVRRMRMGMARGLVPVGMAMCSGYGLQMDMRVVQVGVAVCVLVFDEPMVVLMQMALGQMQKNAREHQGGSDERPDARSLTAER